VTDQIADQLADRIAIADLTAAYAFALDGHDWDGLDEVFTPDATAELGRSLSGLDAIKERIRGALEPLDASQHLVATPQIRIDGDRATCRCYLQAQHVKGGALFMVGGRYDDRVVRTPAGWRIEHRVLTVMWTEGHPKVLGRVEPGKT
jgi:hypothetical protein